MRLWLVAGNILESLQYIIMIYTSASYILCSASVILLRFFALQLASVSVSLFVRHTTGGGIAIDLFICPFFRQNTRNGAKTSERERNNSRVAICCQSWPLGPIACDFAAIAPCVAGRFCDSAVCSGGHDAVGAIDTVTVVGRIGG